MGFGNYVYADTKARRHAFSGEDAPLYRRDKLRKKRASIGKRLSKRASSFSLRPNKHQQRLCEEAIQDAP